MFKAVGPDRCCWPWPYVLYAVVIWHNGRSRYAELIWSYIHTYIFASDAKQLTRLNWWPLISSSVESTNQGLLCITLQNYICIRMRWWQKQYRHSRLKRVILLDVKQSPTAWSEQASQSAHRAGFLSTNAKSGMSATYTVHILSVYPLDERTSHSRLTPNNVIFLSYIRMNVHLPRPESRLFFCPLRAHTCNCTKVQLIHRTTTVEDRRIDKWQWLLAFCTSDMDVESRSVQSG